MMGVSYQWDYDFAIGVCLEVIGLLQPLSDQSVVVYLAIDCKRNGLILVGNWLRTTVNTNDTQTLMGKNWEMLVTGEILLSMPHTCVVGNIASRPIWTTMATLLYHLQSRRLECLRVWHMVASYDSTHVVEISEGLLELLGGNWFAGKTRRIVRMLKKEIWGG